MGKKLTISKLEAARQQLETAIELYFQNSDPISIHTLAAAAYNVIHDINKKRGGSPMYVKDCFVDLWVRQEFQKETRRKINETENFFKHADRDPESSILEFDPSESEYLMVDAVMNFHKLAGKRNPVFLIFFFWFVANSEKILTTEAKRKFDAASKAARNLGRTKFFEVMFPVARREAKLFNSSDAERGDKRQR